MAIRTWEPQLLYTSIMDILKRKGAMVDLELFEALKEKHEGMGFKDFNKALMRLEINGKLFVTNLMKGKRRVELVTK